MPTKELNLLAPKKWVQNFSGLTPTLDTINGIKIGDVAIDTSTTPNREWVNVNNAAGSADWRVFPFNNKNVITVGNDVGYDFTSIKAAMDSITDSSTTNGYLISIAPGTYTEDTIVCKPFVTVAGANEVVTVVQLQASPTQPYLFDTNNQRAVFFNNLRFTNILAGQAAVKYRGNVCKLDHCRFSDTVNLCVDATEVTGTDMNYLHINSCTTSSTGNLGALFNLADNGSSVIQINVTNFLTLAQIKTIGSVSGTNSNVFVELSNSNFIGDGTDNGIVISGSGKLYMEACAVNNFIKGVYSSGVTGSPDIELSALSFDFNNTLNIDIENPNTIGYFSGYTQYSRTSINPASSFYVVGIQPQVLTVGAKGCNFTSIKAALDSITDSSATKRYIVEVTAGSYTEDTMMLPQFTVVHGLADIGVVVSLQSSPSAPYLFDNNNNRSTGIDTLTFDSILTGQSAVKYRGNLMHINGCRIRNNVALLVDANGVIGTQFNYLTIDGCTSASTAVTGSLLHLSSASGTYPVFASFSNYTSLASIQSATEVGIVTGSNTGVNCRLQIQNCRFLGDGTGSCVSIADGAVVEILSTDIEGFNKGIYVPNQGVAPTIKLTGTDVDGNHGGVTHYEIEILHPLAIGSISNTGSIEDVVINSPFVSSFFNGTGNLYLTGNFYQGASIATVTNLTDALVHGQPAGVVRGGEVTIQSGLTVAIAAGTGYIYGGEDPSSVNIQEISWGATTLTLPANDGVFIYMDASGLPHYAPNSATPSFFSTIVLARALTLSSSTLSLFSIPRLTTAMTNRYDRTFRYYLGPVYRSGSVASANVASIDVTPGDYGFSGIEFLPNGNTPITFSTWYRNNSGWYTIAQNQTTAPIGFYDDGTGTLHANTSGYYVKHALFIYGGDDLNPEQYYLVYGQQEFSSQSAAEVGPIPNFPAPFIQPLTTIAGIIVKQGTSSITEIVDLRPTLITKSGTGLTATSDHNALSNLAVGYTHPQYLPNDGHSGMNADLQLNSHGLTGVTTVTSIGSADAVNVSSHVSRHALNGHDAFAFAAPNANVSANSTNFMGTQPSLALSDHTHAIDSYATDYPTLLDAPLGSIVKRDTNGDFAARTITANVIGSSTTFTGSLAGDVTGAQGSTTVAFVGTSSAVNVNNAELKANAATSSNTVSTIVSRDVNSNFSAGTITAKLTGNVSGSAASFTGSLVGDVTGTQGATVVSTVGTSSATNVHNAELKANAATSSNTVSTIVSRDVNGNFAAGTITASISGNATTATTATNSTRTFTGTAPITVDGDNSAHDLTSNKTIAIVAATGSVAGSMSAADKTKLDASTSSNTVSTIVSRDVNSNFSAGTITANLSGNATTSTTATNSTRTFTGTAPITVDGDNAAHDLTANRTLAIVAATGSVAGSMSAADKTKLDAATASNTVSTIVSRDVNGNFAAGTITANLTGNASGTSSNVTGTVAIAHGGTNSTTTLNNNRVMRSSGGAIVEAAAITASSALASDANGIPVASTTTATELGFVHGVTSAIQTQINNLYSSNRVSGSNQTTTGTGATNVTNMVLSIAANVNVNFEFKIFCSCSGAGGGAAGTNFAVTVPSGCTLLAAAHGTVTNSENARYNGENITTTGALTTNAYVKSMTGFIRVHGVAVNGSTAGTIQLQFASATNGQTSSILTNSFCSGIVTA